MYLEHDGVTDVEIKKMVEDLSRMAPVDVDDNDIGMQVIYAIKLPRVFESEVRLFLNAVCVMLTVPILQFH